MASRQQPHWNDESLQEYPVDPHDEIEVLKRHLSLSEYRNDLLKKEMCQNLSGCNKESDSLRDKLANTMKYNDTLKNKISKAEKINSSLNVELKDTQRKCYGLQSVIKKLENKCDDLYYAMEQEKKKYLSLKSDYDNIHRDFCKIQQE